MFNLKLGRRELEMMKPCPFCGTKCVTVNNTHTASYWMECDCGAEVHGKSYGSHLTSEKQTLRHHQLSKASALKAWNTRVN